jgi:hypothetical protein
MTSATTIPVGVTPEAAARLAELGLQAAADRMIAHARQNLPEVVRIEVGLNERYDTGGDAGVAIDAWSRRPFDPAERISWDLAGWMVTEFPPEVLEHLHLSYHPGAPYAG